MLDSIINAFLEFKWFMLLNVGLTIAAGVILWFATEQFGYQRKNRYLFAFFMGMKNREILWTGFAWTQMVFILSCVILGGEMNLVYLVFLLLLYLALLVGSVMRDYLKTIRFDSLILLVLILLTLSVLHYTIYNFVKDMLFVTEERSRIHEKRVEE